jgi:hypothetical protein
VRDIKLYWAFYKSTLPVNWIISVSFALILSLPEPAKAPALMPIMLMTVGPAVSILKRLSNEDECYFYYNCGITKMKLIPVNFLFNAVTALIWLLVYYYVKPA